MKKKLIIRVIYHKATIWMTMCFYASRIDKSTHLNFENQWKEFIGVKKKTLRIHYDLKGACVRKCKKIEPAI